jgi:antitoxin component YwqK of YwqJK toxin-antitoxin module
MKPRNYRSSIPTSAAEVIEASFDCGAKKSASYFLSGKKVGYRQWNERGELEFEYGIKDGKKHGREYCFFENGQPYEVTPYCNGRIHGTGKQWSDEGKVVITYKLINGTGLDLWCGHQNDSLSEEHYYPKDGESGYHRLWHYDEKYIRQEYHFSDGRGYHGIWREWNEKGKMRRGFPQYYVNDRRVTKRQYLKASEMDESLPPYRPAEDRPYRKLPPEYLAQRKKRRK